MAACASGLRPIRAKFATFSAVVAPVPATGVARRSARTAQTALAGITPVAAVGHQFQAAGRYQAADRSLILDNSSGAAGAAVPPRSPETAAAAVAGSGAVMGTIGILALSAAAARASDAANPAMPSLAAAIVDRQAPVARADNFGYVQPNQFRIGAIASGLAGIARMSVTGILTVSIALVIEPVAALRTPICNQIGKILAVIRRRERLNNDIAVDLDGRRRNRQRASVQHILRVVAVMKNKSLVGRKLDVHVGTRVLR